jgi:hypothetical protein
MRRRTWLALAVLTLAAVLGSDGRPVHAQSTPKAAGAPAAESLEPLKERVLTYWQARVQRNYRAEYDLLEPRARALLDPEQYGQGRTVQYLAVQIEDAERRGNFARIGVRLLVRVQIPPIFPRSPGIDSDQSTVLQDYWVRIGGTWYRSLEANAGATPPWPAVGD